MIGLLVNGVHNTMKPIEFRNDVRKAVKITLEFDGAVPGLK